MTIHLLCFTDGRDTIRRTIASFEEHVRPSFGDWTFTIINDSQSLTYEAGLRYDFGARFSIVHLHDKAGFDGAIRAGWDALSYIAAEPGDFVFHLEDDFVFNGPVDVREMQHILNLNPEIAQVALLRQPWSEVELEAGGIIQMWPDLYTDFEDVITRWCTHRLFWTTNPCLYRVELTFERTWPTGAGSEKRFTDDLLEDPHLRFAYLGNTTDPPRVHHIGTERAGVNY